MRTRAETARPHGLHLPSGPAHGVDRPSPRASRRWLRNHCRSASQGRDDNERNQGRHRAIKPRRRDRMQEKDQHGIVTD